MVKTSAEMRNRKPLLGIISKQWKRRRSCQSTIWQTVSEICIRMWWIGIVEPEKLTFYFCQQLIWHYIDALSSFSWENSLAVQFSTGALPLLSESIFNCRKEMLYVRMIFYPWLSFLKNKRKKTEYQTSSVDAREETPLADLYLCWVCSDLKKNSELQ